MFFEGLGRRSEDIEPDTMHNPNGNRVDNPFAHNPMYDAASSSTGGESFWRPPPMYRLHSHTMIRRMHLRIHM